jgi:hypothetical protein
LLKPENVFDGRRDSYTSDDKKECDKNITPKVFELKKKYV